MPRRSAASKAPRSAPVWPPEMMRSAFAPTGKYPSSCGAAGAMARSYWARRRACTIGPVTQAAAEHYLDAIAPRVAAIDGWLADALASAQMPENLRTAAQHAVLVGGKRLRPLLAVLS